MVVFFADHSVALINFFEDKVNHKHSDFVYIFIYHCLFFSIGKVSLELVRLCIILT